MRPFYFIVLKICPLIAFLYCILSIFITIYIRNEFSPLYAFFFIQLYLNWYSAYRISKQLCTLKAESFNNRSTVLNIHQSTSSFGSERETKFWFCEKCQNYTRKATIHCPLCKKCYHFRDHHCFFMGTCVLRQNMGNFILLCFYSAFTCFYSLTVLGPYLYDHFNHFIRPDSTLLNVLLSFCFPIALARFLFSEQESCLLLVTLFDALVATFFIAFFYGSWKLNACLTGRQIYNFNIRKKDKIREIFGYYGLLNILFPIDSLVLGSRFTKNCDLKDI